MKVYADCHKFKSVILCKNVQVKLRMSLIKKFLFLNNIDDRNTLIEQSVVTVIQKEIKRKTLHGVNLVTACMLHQCILIILVKEFATKCC